MQRSDHPALIGAITAALLFGIVVPVSKILLVGTGPITLAALLYMGAGTGLLLLKIIRPQQTQQEAPVTRRDIPFLVVIVIVGSVIGPILLMTGLTMVPAGTASLLLNAELVMTGIIATLFFSEPLGRRVVLAMTAVVIGGLILSVDPTGTFGISAGAVLILGACICWGIDNNVTRSLSGKDPASVVIIKGMCAGIVGLVLATLIGESLPSIHVILYILITGFFGYGLSLVLFIRSLRTLGAIRTGSLFALAPFIGAGISWVFLGEAPGYQVFVSFLFMAIGVYLIATEDHHHLHSHIRVSHDHRHRHDDGHHTHSHLESDPSEHAHLHQHDLVTHDHQHTPDLHHYHDHELMSDDKKSEKNT
ncbi:MAG TPA: DMT family transporter [Methanospirillum sp.]|uniref:DMT family transporter n=1 Tax=Methanospirillum sp. TaxID=45200 RepID=UPI002B9AC486|nr:DMT family transporter [Methanospirillum sp.]HWQ63717.1 DMT family transporter [Methanospirillum sp.]